MAALVHWKKCNYVAAVVLVHNNYLYCYCTFNCTELDDVCIVTALITGNCFFCYSTDTLAEVGVFTVTAAVLLQK